MIGVTVVLVISVIVCIAFIIVKWRRKLSCIFAPNNLRPQRFEDDAMTSQQNQAVEMGSAMQKVQQTAEISGAVATPDTKQDHAGSG